MILFILKVEKKYKYLVYLPKPINIHKSNYDLVDDVEFCELDSRTPLLLATEQGIFPSKGVYSGKPESDYKILEGLENQKSIGFIGRAYLSKRERLGIYELKIEHDTIEKLRNGQLIIDLNLW